VDLVIERVPTPALVPFARNARTHSDDQVAQIAASIREFGFTNPVLVDGDNGIIAGHGRVLAAGKLGMQDVPCIRLAHLTEIQKRAYVLADNKLALNAGWNEQLLALELAHLQADEFDMALTGFTGDELAAILRGQFTDGLTDPDEAPPLPEHPVSRTGQVWICGRHRIACGDATNPDDVRAALGGAQPSLMVTDPPYGVDYEPAWRALAGVNKSRRKMGEVTNDDRADWREAWALFGGDIAYVWHAGRFAAVVQHSLEAADLVVRAQIIWAKDRFALSRGDYHWQHEPCWYAVRKGSAGHWNGDRAQSTLWNIKAREDDGHGHSTQKPVECMRRPIENNSSVGQAVYDPFVGTGTTVIAAEQTGRTCYAVEIHPGYVDVAVKRWQAFTGKAARLDGDGRTFDELASEGAEATA